MSLTVQQKINIANTCCIYADEELNNGRTNGGLRDERLPSLLFAYRQGVEWLYDLDPTNEDLDSLSNYLLSICKHQAKAENEIVGGGSIPAVSPGTPLVAPIDWIVSDAATGDAPLMATETTVTLDGTNGMPDLRGYNIDFFRGGQPQYTTNPGDGSTYYSWNTITGIFTISSAAQLSEQMRISPIR